MNILIPHTWLLEHLETPVSPQKLQQLVSLSGPSVERIYDRLGDNVYDIEITTNRVDSMSIRGVAREAAVILTQAGHPSQLRPLKHQLETYRNRELPATAAAFPLPDINDNPELNRRLMCVVLSDINRAATPDWMAKRLEQIEVNVHEAAIDITNYVTHELGHPCHAFDYDKLMATGGVITITEAQPDQTFTIIDGTTFQTKGGEVVFTDGEGTIIDLPSIKGTKNTSVDDSTRTILLLMESIRPDKVRFASMTHAIRTTAAQLLEKNLDPYQADDTMALAIALYEELCDARQVSPIYDTFDQAIQADASGTHAAPPQPKAVKLHSKDLNRYLGLNLDSATVTTIFEQLGCQVTVEQSEPNAPQYLLTVTPPTFRSDLSIPADLIEEVARIYGYHNLPSTLMSSAIPTQYQSDTDFELEHRLKSFLAHQGLQEAYTYSMVSPELAGESGQPLAAHLKLSNPLTEDMVYLRRSLVPSLREMIDANPMVRPLSVFELASIYESVSQTAVPNQPLKLSIVSTLDYRTFKGIVEALLAQIYVTQVETIPDNAPQPGFAQSAALIIKPAMGSHFTHLTEPCNIGSIGLEAVHGWPAAQLDWQQLLKVARKNPTYQPLPKTSFITEDMTFTLAAQTEIGPIISALRTISDRIHSVEFLDRYQQNVSFRISYHNPATNISSQDIEPLRRQVVEMVTHQFGGQLVGAIT